jgi:hypothetical protein
MSFDGFVALSADKNRVASAKRPFLERHQIDNCAISLNQGVVASLLVFVRVWGLKKPNRAAGRGNRFVKHDNWRIRDSLPIDILGKPIAVVGGVSPGGLPAGLILSQPIG